MTHDFMGDFVSESLSEQPQVSGIIGGQFRQGITDVDPPMADAYSQDIPAREIREKNVIALEPAGIFGHTDNSTGLISHELLERLVGDYRNVRGRTRYEQRAH